MKRMKKILSVLLSVVMVMAMGITAFAVDGDSTQSTGYTVTINNATGTYAIYQVFTGDLTENESGSKTLSNVKWGSGVTKFSYKINAQGDASDDATQIAEYLAEQSDDSSVAKDFAKKAIDKKGTASATVTASNGTAVFNGLAAGYYVVENTSVDNTESYTEYILQVVGNAEVNNKADVPSSYKKVKDINDSTETTATNWQDSADYDIGDTIPFKLTGTVASNYDDYTTYYYAFHDVESQGLTFNKDSVVVKVGDTTVDKQYYTVQEGTETSATKCTFEVVFSDLKQIVNASGEKLVTKDSTITVEYTSTLNEEAVIGSEGNPNTMHLEFSNNPNADQGGTTGTTPDDTVIVFTYKLVINKVDQDGKALTGADFKLEKRSADNNWVEVDSSKKSISDYKDPDDDSKVTKNCVFTFKGLDDGVYRITETTTPSGFNTIEPITFTVTAIHTIEADAPTLNSLTGAAGTGTIEFTSNEQDGSLSINIVNKEGTVLPSTGGIGTTVFYVVGAILMIGAGVVLVSRRRANR